MAGNSNKLKILQIGDPILETKTDRVSNIQDLKVVNLIKLMMDYLLNDSTSVGLAAPQVGESLSISVIKKITKTVENGEKVEHVEIIPLINPKIIYKSGIEKYTWEGCLSIGAGEERLFGPVKRPDKIKVKYLNRDGNEEILEANGFLAHVIQHEVDHLDGILFISHITNPMNIWKGADLDKYLEEHDEYPQIAEIEAK